MTTKEKYEFLLDYVRSIGDYRQKVRYFNPVVSAIWDLEGYSVRFEVADDLDGLINNAANKQALEARMVLEQIGEDK